MRDWAQKTTNATRLGNQNCFEPTQRTISGLLGRVGILFDLFLLSVLLVFVHWV